MSYPRISVVTPCLNQAQFVESTLRSIHDPGYPNLEHIVIDGGSTDGSADIIAAYAEHLAYWVSEEDDGQTAALAKGFARATGEIQCWLNSDDLFEPQTLFEVAEFFTTNTDAEFVYGDSTWIDVNGMVIKPKREHGWNRYVWLYDHDFIPQPSAFWKRDLYLAVGGVDTSFALAMDADLWIRFAERTQPYHTRSFWSQMRFYPEQKNTRMRDRSLVEKRRIRNRYVSPASVVIEGFRSVSARSVRIALKALNGGYSPSELAQHAGLFLGKGTWENQQARRHDAET